MKRFLSILIVLMLMLGLVACNNGGEGTGSSDGTTDAPKTEGTGEIVVSDSETTSAAPETTEPPVLEPPASGFCVVGESDAESKKVAVLFANGLVETMDLAGEAPAAGTIAYFEVEGTMIAFSEATLTDYSQWRVFAEANGDLFYNTDGTTEWRHYLTDTCATFIKFSDTNWMAFEGKNVIKIANGLTEYPNTAWPCFLWVIDVDGDGTIEGVFADATKTYEGGEVSDITLLFDPTGAGLTEGDKNVVLTPAA